MKRITGLIVVLFVLSSFQGMKLVKTKVDDSITISIPETFLPMTEAEINTKYVSTKPPVALFTDQSRMVDLGINVAFSRWRPEDLELMRSFYKSNIMGLYDEVQFITEEMREINGRQYAIFEFLSIVTDDENTAFDATNRSQYTYIQYTIVNYKTVLFNFSCPARLKGQWQQVAGQIMSTVKIAKNI